MITIFDLTFSQVDRTLERRESVMSTQSTEDGNAGASAAGAESDLDKDGIVQEATRDWAADKPRLAGKKLTVMPPRDKDHDESSLCAIM